MSVYTHDLKEALNYLDELKKKGYILGLENMKFLMEKLGRPDKKLKYVHVAGTNGKGSLCTYTYSVLMQAGYKVGIYTSPEVSSYNDRIKVNDKCIDDSSVNKILKKIKKVSEENSINITAFEAETAAAILYFVQEGVEIAVLEVGMGGRLDATNFIDDKLAAVIMHIGMDHMQYLGNSIEEIAREKCGIIKENTPVAAYGLEGIDIIREVCEKKNSDLYVADFSAINIKKDDIYSCIFDYKSYRDVEISMRGEFQIRNACVALELFDVLRKKGLSIAEDDIKKGMKKAIIDGRFELLRENPMFIIDGAHNPQGVDALTESIEKYLKNKKIVFIYAVMKDKDYIYAINKTLQYAEMYICDRIENDRAMDNDILRKEIESRNAHAVSAYSAKEAVDTAIKEAGKDGTIIAFGTLYHVADIMEAVKS